MNSYGHNVYGMNDSTTLDEQDFESVRECMKVFNETLDERLKPRDIYVTEYAKNAKNVNELNVPVIRYKFNVDKISLDKSKKKPFYNVNMYYHSVEAPNIYKLSGGCSTFDESEKCFNNALPNKEEMDDQEIMRNELRKFLSTKDIKKKPFGSQVASQSSTEEPVKEPVKEPIKEAPKPPPKWEKYIDSEGDVYYYNIKTGQTQWNVPEELQEDTRTVILR